MGRISVRDKLFLLTTISGAAFISMQLKCSTLDFRTMGSVFPSITPSFPDQQGFFSVLRWAENLHTPQGVATLVRMVTQSTVASATTASSSLPAAHSAVAPKDMAAANCDAASPFSRWTSTDVNSSECTTRITNSSATAHESAPFHVQLAQIASVEVYVHLSKTLLQCGILLSLYRLKVLSRRRAVSAICLCFLVLLCWKMAQSCLHEILVSRKPLHGAAAGASPSSASRAIEMTAAFLSTLFLLRFASLMVVNAVLGRAYQRYFCASWPESWRRVPRYLGSKDLVLTTLYFASSGVALMSVSCVALRSLCEAALQFETAALAGSLFHIVYFRLVHVKDKPKQVGAGSEHGIRPP